MSPPRAKINPVRHQSRHRNKAEERNEAQDLSQHPTLFTTSAVSSVLLPPHALRPSQTQLAP